MFQKYRSLFFSLLCLLLALAGYLYAQRQPVLFLPSNTDLADPSRYAFLTESDAAAALVVDMREKRYFGRLALPSIARHSSIAAHSASLAIGNQQELFVQNLRDGSRKHIRLSENIDALAGAHDKLALRAGKSFLLYSLPELKPLSSIELDSRSISLHYADLQSRWLAVEQPPAIVLYEHNLERIALPYAHISPAALSPDNRFLAFQAQNAAGQGFAVIWSLENQEILRSEPLAAPSLRPLIDNRNEFIYFVDTKGKGLQFSTKDLNAAPRRFDSLENAQDIALGFLETRLIVRNADSLVLIDSGSLQPLARLSLAEKGQGLFVSADSKTVLIGGQQQLFSLQLPRNQLSSIALPEAIQMRDMFMGAGNRLCH